MKRAYSLLLVEILCLIFVGMIIRQPVFGASYLEPLQGWRIMVDPGTGNELIQGPFIENKKSAKGEPEAEANLRVALFLAQFLKNAGAEAVLSRQSNVDLPSLDERLKKARDFNANLIISIHHEQNKDPEANYAKAYYYPPDNEPEKTIARHLVEALQSELKIQGKSAEAFSFPLVSRAEIPCVMVSCGCISNSKMKKQVKELEFNRQEAIAILKGMMNFQKELTDTQKSRPPLIIQEEQPAMPIPLSITPPKEISTQAPGIPVPVVPKPPMPLPQTTATLPKPEEGEIIAPAKTFAPPLLNPADGNFDQSWLFGETWGTLPTRKGASFAVPEGVSIKAAADGTVVEASANPLPAVPDYPNCIIIKHVKVIPDVPTIFTVYGKLSSMKVKKGDRVKKGEVIGTTGAPSTATNPSRDTEFVYEVRWGNMNQSSIVNPELFTEHKTRGTGIIIGKLTDKNGKYLYSVRIDGVTKAAGIERYSYSLTYSMESPASEFYGENFAIGDVPAAEYTLSCEYGTRKVKVEAGKITIVTWVVK